MDLNNIKIISDYVMVSGNIMHNRVSFLDGELYIDSTFEPSHHVCVTAEVLKLPEKLRFSHNDLTTMRWQTNIEVMVGDKAFIDYYAIMMSIGKSMDKSVEFSQDSFIYHENRYYPLIKYEDIFAVLRDGELIPMNGYVIAEPVLENFDTEIIKAPHVVESANMAVVRKIGSCNKQYRGNKYLDADGFGVGDTIIYNGKKRLLENELHMELDRKYYVIQRKDILAVIS